MVRIRRDASGKLLVMGIDAAVHDVDMRALALPVGRIVVVVERQAGLVNAVQTRDAPLVLGLSLVIATFYIVVNIVADLMVVLLVPKLRTALR